MSPFYEDFRRSAPMHREQVSQKNSLNIDKRHFSVALESVLQKKHLKSSFYEDSKNIKEDAKPKVFVKRIAEIEEPATDCTPIQTTQRYDQKSLLSLPVKNLRNDPQKKEILGVMWRKILTNSYKEVNTTINEVFFNFTKVNIFS